jgi:hypothetical protein
LALTARSGSHRRIFGLQAAFGALRGFDPDRLHQDGEASPDVGCAPPGAPPPEGRLIKQRAGGPKGRAFKKKAAGRPGCGVSRTRCRFWLPRLHQGKTRSAIRLRVSARTRCAVGRGLLVTGGLFDRVKRYVFDPGSCRTLGLVPVGAGLDCVRRDG